MKSGKMSVDRIKISDRVNVHVREPNHKYSDHNGDERSGDLICDPGPHDEYKEAYGAYQ